MNDDTPKPINRLDRALAAYAELYPSIARRLEEASAAMSPEFRRRRAAMDEAFAERDDRRRETLAASWGLTPVEARLAIHLADGGSLASYAELFSVSIGTARSQLKAVFAKTGVKRQAALAARVPRG